MKKTVLLLTCCLLSNLTSFATDKTAVKPTLHPAAADVLKLTQAHIDNETILRCINNNPGKYNLSVDEVIYLKGAGVTSEILCAMLAHKELATQYSQAPQTSVAPPNRPAPTYTQTYAPAQYTQPAYTAYQTPITYPTAVYPADYVQDYPYTVNGVAVSPDYYRAFCTDQYNNGYYYPNTYDYPYTVNGVAVSPDYYRAFCTDQYNNGYAYDNRYPNTQGNWERARGNWEHTQGTLGHDRGIWGHSNNTQGYNGGNRPPQRTTVRPTFPVRGPAERGPIAKPIVRSPANHSPANHPANNHR